MNTIKQLIEKYCPDGVEYKKLGEVCTVLRGKRLTKKELSGGGPFPVFHGGIEPIGYYSKGNRQAESVMIIDVGASAGTVGYCKMNFGLRMDVFAYRMFLHLSKDIYSFIAISRKKSQI